MAIKKIMLACDASATTPLLVATIEKAISAQDKNVMVFATTSPHIDDKILSEQPSIVLLAPQLAYLKGEVKAQTDQVGVPLAVIQLNDFNDMNGERILQLAERFMYR
ncbi:PTS sugar transporter subunit IIB [Leuconostoc holzapfelii]|uniref:PTS sugar transporter subunit IIB n=1 Tax=Leuconostoc holzapfelii TaxID=434464 RepID=A0A846ZE23_9LACO|nr:PTS sugar transporter subunit IIB [Leuconostoc holzapfelii]NKZ17749.1 PTS sugar transporter subunit IIB [Leuconostoc holzapfelii]